MLVFALGLRDANGWWRIMAAVGVLPALCSMTAIGCGMVPETPRWLASQNRHEEAREAALALELDTAEFKRADLKLKPEADSPWAQRYHCRHCGH